MQAGSPVGGVRKATSCFSDSLSPSLPLSLKINKVFFKKVNRIVTNDCACLKKGQKGNACDFVKRLRRGCGTARVSCAVQVTKMER